MKIRFLLTMAIPLLLAACDDSDESGGEGGGNVSAPVTFTASIQPEAKTRITVNNGWTGITDTKMAISIGGEVKEYAVSEIGEVTSAQPFYWEDKETLTVDAWYPYNGGVKPETITVSADQSVPANYEKSDYLEVVGAAITPKKPVLTFTHRTTKIVCTVTSEYEDAETAQVTLLNLTGVDEGTSVKTTDKLKALVVAQTIPANTEFMEIGLAVAGRKRYKLDEDLVLKPGTQYDADIFVTFQGLEVEIREQKSWSADVEVAPGLSPEVNTGTADGWTNNGTDDTLEGSDGQMNAGNTANGWQDGDSEERPADGSETSINNGNVGGWQGGTDAESTPAGTKPDNTTPDA